jgi:hypothetical protein
LPNKPLCEPRSWSIRLFRRSRCALFVCMRDLCAHRTPIQSIILRAQGEARSAELIGDAVRKNKGFLQLRKLEAARENAAVLATSGNRVMLDSGTLLLDGMSTVSKARM